MRIRDLARWGVALGEAWPGANNLILSNISFRKLHDSPQSIAAFASLAWLMSSVEPGPHSRGLRPQRDSEKMAAPDGTLITEEDRESPVLAHTKSVGK